MRDNLAGEVARHTLHDAEVRAIVQKVRQEQREKDATKAVTVLCLVLLLVVGWLAFTESGAQMLRWMDR